MLHPTKNHLVISVSTDSSLELLGAFADVIVLDTDPLPPILKRYETLYIRSHFSRPSLLPQVFHTEIESIVQRAVYVNPNVTYIDAMSTVDAIVDFEDKWHQYEIFKEYMPKTQLLDTTQNTAFFKRPVFKKRLSSQGVGVTWDAEKITGPAEDWIVQESLDIAEELRIYVIRGRVHPVGVIRQSKTTQQRVQAVDYRTLTQDEIDFSLQASSRAPGLDIIGLDIARTPAGELTLIEANRSPDFAAFEKLTGVNLAGTLYRRV
jgi:hypothetical protein